MNNSVFLLLISIALIIGASCNKSDETTEPNKTCTNNIALIDSGRYNAAQQQSIQPDIIEATIEGDCLTIQFASGGCDGSTWEYALISHHGVARSNPPQRDIILEFKNEEECEAYITLEQQFDITNFRTEGSNAISFNFFGFDEQLLYEYQ